jgi:transposase
MGGCECGKQSERAGETKKVASYLGLNPSEESSGGRQHTGAISK